MKFPAHMFLLPSLRFHLVYGLFLHSKKKCFTSNETDWDAVKGSVSGNILTIECQNTSSTATISWMVIGDRKDEHMKSEGTDWTDANGKPIIEPEKTSADKAIPPA